jgi:hypothetical protein
MQSAPFKGWPLVVFVAVAYGIVWLLLGVSQLFGIPFMPLLGCGVRARDARSVGKEHPDSHSLDEGRPPRPFPRRRQEACDPFVQVPLGILLQEFHDGHGGDELVDAGRVDRCGEICQARSSYPEPRAAGVGELTVLADGVGEA